MSTEQASNQLPKVIVTPDQNDKDPVQNLRWLACFVASLSIFGPMYQYGLPISVQTPIENYFGINDGQYNLLYSLGASGMLFIPIIGGFLTDYLGCRIVLLASITVILIGQILAVIACAITSFPLLIFARFVSMGLFDTMYIARYKMITKLFYKRYIAIALGIAATFNKGSLVANSIFTPDVQKETNSLAYAWMLGVIANTISLAAAIYYCHLEGKIYAIEQTYETSTTTSENQHDDDDGQAVKFSDIKKLDVLVFYVAISGGISYSVFNALYDNITAFFERKFLFSSIEASDLTTVFLLTSLLSIFAHSGYMAKFGGRNYLILLSTVIFVSSLFLFQWLPPCNRCMIIILPLILFGWYLGAYNVTIYSSMPFLVPKKRMGLAFGIIALANNIFMVSLPFIYGVIVDACEYAPNEWDYTWVFIFLIAVSLVGLFFAVLIFIRNERYGQPLKYVLPSQVCTMIDEPLKDTLNEN